MGVCSSNNGGVIVDLLKPTPFGLRLTHDQLVAMSKFFRLRKYDKGSNIFVQDSRVQTTDGLCYVIVEGEVDVAVNKSYLCVKGDGDCLGLATVEDGIRMATATARTSVSALELSCDNFKTYMAANPSLHSIVSPLLGDVVDRLAKIDMFNGVPPNKMRLLAVLLRAVALRADDILFEEGSLGQSLFIISEGSVMARARAEDGTVKRLHEFQESDMFGEIALIMDIPRTATLVATRDAMLFELHRDSFQRFLKLVPGNLQLQNVMKERTAEHFRKYKVPFFEAIPDNKYPILASLCKVEQVPKNTVIFKAGDIGSTFYLIFHGGVRVTVKKKRETVAADGDTKDGSSTARGSVDNKDKPPVKRDHSKKPSVSISSSTATELSKSEASKKGAASTTANSTDKNQTRRESISKMEAKRRQSVSAQQKANDDGPLLPLDDDEIELCRMGPGQYFGEIALVQDTPRTATITTVSRTVLLSITKDNFATFFKEAPEAIADFEIKLARYGVQLRSVIYHPVGLEYFTQHLRSEYSEENISFWKECRDYRHLTYHDADNTEFKRPSLQPAISTAPTSGKAKLGLPDDENITAAAPVKVAAEAPISPKISPMQVASMTIDESDRMTIRQMQKLSVAAGGGVSGASEDARYVIRTPVLVGPGVSLMQVPPPILDLRKTSSTLQSQQAAAAAIAAGASPSLFSRQSSTGVPMVSISPIQLTRSSSTQPVVVAGSQPLGPPAGLTLTTSLPLSSSAPAPPMTPLLVPAPPSPLHLPEIKLDLSPEEIEADERKRADLLTAFNLYQTNDGLSAKQLQALMALLGVSCKTSIAEQLTLLMDRDPNTHIVSRDAFILAVTKYSQMWNKRESRTNFLDRLVRKLNRAIQDIRLAKLRHSFDQFDADHSGKVELAEYISIMRALGFTEVETKTLQDNFKKMDKVGDGAVGFTQFVEFMIGEKQNKAKLNSLLLTRATTIYNQFVSPSAPNQVNIKGPTREDIAKEIESGKVSIHTFDRAEREILKLLSADSFNRFKQSSLFQEFLDQAQSYQRLEGKDEQKIATAVTRRDLVRSGSFKTRDQPISIDDLALKLGDDSVATVKDDVIRAAKKQALLDNL